MKLISFCVPCFNSAAYMRHCIDSLLVGGEDVQIIIVDDGSTKDNTGDIADEYQQKFPNIVKVIHQENGGHGEGVNQGIKNATGLYFKVVDSDDWLDEDALVKVIAKIKEFQLNNNFVDLLLCNYVYEYADKKKSRTIKFKKAFPKDKVFTFDELGKLKPNEFITMHTAIYRTEILQNMKLTLPKHTFYVDNLYVFTPLPLVESLYYMDVDLYRYFVGRSDQSINESVIMKRIDQHIKVTEIAMEAHNLNDVEKKCPRLAKYMRSFISILMAITSIYLIKIGTKDALEKKKMLWDKLKNIDEKTYKFCRKQAVGVTSTNSRLGMWLCKVIYVCVRKILKFN